MHTLILNKIYRFKYDPQFKTGIENSNPESEQISRFEDTKERMLSRIESRKDMREALKKELYNLDSQDTQDRGIIDNCELQIDQIKRDSDPLYKEIITDYIEIQALSTEIYRRVANNQISDQEIQLCRLQVPSLELQELDKVAEAYRNPSGNALISRPPETKAGIKYSAILEAKRSFKK
jgi:hypothetical protein